MARPHLWCAEVPATQYSAASLPSWLSLVCGFVCALLGEFVVDVLLKQIGIGPNHPPAVHEDRRSAVDFEFLAIGVTGVDRGSSFWAGHAALKSVVFESSLSRIVRH